MKYLGSLKSLSILSILVSFALIAGCNNNKSGSSKAGNTGHENLAITQQGPKKDSTSLIFTAELKGENEVPSVHSDASGSVTVILQGDSVHVKGQFSGLSAAYTASHIYKGDRTKNGKVVQALDPSENSNKKAGSWGGSYYWSTLHINQLKAGALYINVASRNNEEGEIRGQLIPQDSKQKK